MQLVEKLRSAYINLRIATDHALMVTTERNRLIQEIHRALEQTLTLITAQLDQARIETTGRQTVEQALQQAKSLASEALANVRRSVHAGCAQKRLGAAADRQ